MHDFSHTGYHEDGHDGKNREAISERGKRQCVRDYEKHHREEEGKQYTASPLGIHDAWNSERHNQGLEDDDVSLRPAILRHEDSEPESEDFSDRQ